MQISHDNNDNDSCAFVDWHLEVSDLMNVGTYTRYFLKKVDLWFLRQVCMRPTIIYLLLVANSFFDFG